MKANIEQQISKMKGQTIGVEVEMNSISREKAAKNPSKFPAKINKYFFKILRKFA